MIGGNIGNNITFFFQTDDPKLGLSPAGTAATKTLTTGNATSPGFLIQDAWAEYKVNTHLQLAAGEMLVPSSRQNLQSTLSYYTVNISAVSTVNNAPWWNPPCAMWDSRPVVTSSTIACNTAAASSTVSAMRTDVTPRGRRCTCSMIFSIAKRNMPTPARHSASARFWLSTLAATTG